MHFVEPEDLLLCLQKPATGPHPDPYKSSPYPPILRNSFNPL
jgi:hypothetical protein